MIDHVDGKDVVTLLFETELPEGFRGELEAEVEARVKSKIGIKVVPHAVDIFHLPRSEKKTNRIFDNRY